MKVARRCYLILPPLALVLLVVIGGCALRGPGNGRDAARHLVTIYRVSALLAQAAPAVSGSLRRNLPQSVALDRRKRVDRLVNRIFAPAPLQADTVRRLAQAARSQGRTADLARVANWLDQPLAQRMTALESKVGELGFIRGFQQFVHERANDQRKQRLAIVDQLAADMHLADLQTRFNVTLLRAVIRARNLVIAPGDRVDESQIQRILSNTSAGLHRKLAQQLPLMLLYVYRDVDTDTLERYAAIQHRSAMVWVNKTFVQAIGGALEAAGDNIPKTFKTEDRLSAHNH